MNRIALIFDFDDTLAPDSTSSFLESIGVDVPHFWKKKVQPLLDEDWDPIPAYLYKMIELSSKGETAPITKSLLESYGSKINFHKGVSTMFKRLEEHVETNYTDIQLEFYLISSGIGDILKNTPVSRYFKDIWASDFTYDEQGRIEFPKKIVSFTDKTRYLFHISKGLVGAKYRGRPFDVNKKVSNDKLKVPIEHMIFVGDGYTDIPCFSLIKKGGGYAFGVYDNENRDKWGRAWGFIEEGRVSSLYSANFAEKSDLSNSLLMAIDSVANRIKLKTLSY